MRCRFIRIREQTILICDFLFKFFSDHLDLLVGAMKLSKAEQFEPIVAYLERQQIVRGPIIQTQIKEAKA